jgi:CDGSH-type Zn-finger protein
MAATADRHAPPIERALTCLLLEDAACAADALAPEGPGAGPALDRLRTATRAAAAEAIRALDPRERAAVDSLALFGAPALIPPARTARENVLVHVWAAMDLGEAPDAAATAAALALDVVPLSSSARLLGLLDRAEAAIDQRREEMRRALDPPPPAPASGATITPYRDGPYIVRGDVAILDQDGREIDARRGTIALCRCGRSRMRPFCDGTHALVGFEAAGGLEAPDRRVEPAD